MQLLNRSVTKYLALSTLFALTSWWLYRAAFVAEDAYITLRVVDQLLSGNGAVWNPHERVQVYTHPLWFLLLSLAIFATKEYFLTVIFLSLFLVLFSIYLFAKRLAFSPIATGALVIAFMASKAWTDFAGSGLENALSYFLFTYLLLFATEKKGELTKGQVISFCCLVSLLLITRHDHLLICLPLLSYYLFHSRKVVTIPVLLVGFSPFLLWSLFSVVYYGFPFPNTAFAKLSSGASRPYLIEQGTLYFLESIVRDPVTVIGILCCAIFQVSSYYLKRGRIEPLLITLGILLYLAYLVWIGGGYMTGRFFATPYHLSVGLLILTAPKVLHFLLIVVITPYLFLNPHTHGDLPPRLFAGFITDTRANAQGLTDLESCVTRWREGKHCPKDGRRVDKSKKLPVRVEGTIGRRGYSAGLDTIIIDHRALSDPLLARLPSLRRKPRIGHMSRPIPEGYLETIRAGENKIAHPALHTYYGHLTTVTTGELFSWKRFKTIANLNFGGFSDLLEKYVEDSYPNLRKRMKKERLPLFENPNEKLNSVKSNLAHRPHEL